MSSGIATPQPPPAVPVAPPSECERVIDERLERTRRRVKWVDIAGGLIALAIGVLAFLFLAALVDHWLIVGGLGFWGRLALWLLLVAVGGAYFVRRVLPPLLGRIHPLFAAATIEQSQPSLKNSLLNFLFLRGRRQEVAGPIYRAMEYRAAVDLSKIQVDVAVDHTRVIRLGYVLLAVVAMFSLYLVLSPKNPLRSAARVLWPWSAIEAPTRVTIHDIRPGDATAYYGDSVTVSAELSGLRADEPVALIYSTADGQSVDQVIPLSLPTGDSRFQCRLPPGNLGLQQDHTYCLSAGDCRTGRYRIVVQIAPAIAVDKVSYHYPAYTALPDRSVERQGDLQAIEGTEVTLHASANVEIKRSTPEIDLGCTGRQGLRMSAEGRTATGQLTLRLDPRDVSRPEYDSYQLRFADVDGRENEHPIRHRIEVIRDLPPDVQLVEPQQTEVQVPVNGKLPIKTLAEDPDFGLRRVVLRVQHDDGRNLRIVPLLEKPKPEKAWQGPFSGLYTFEPARLGLKSGNRVQYSVEAEDNKEPAPGLTATHKRWITVVGAEQPRQSKKPETGQGERSQAGRDKGEAGDHGKRSENKSGGDGQDEPSKDDKRKAGDKNSQPGKGGRDQRQQPSGERPGGGEQADQSQSGKNDGKQNASPSGQGKQGQGKQGQGQSSGQQQLAQDQPKERIDPETDPGDAMQEILKDRQKKEQPQPPANPSKSDHQPSPDQQQQRSGEQQQPGQQSQGEKPSGQKSDREKSENPKSEDLKSENSKPGEQKSASENSGGEKAQVLKSNDQKSGSEKSENLKSENSKAGEQKSASQKSGSEKSGKEGGAGEKQQGEKSAGQSSEGKKSDGEKQNGEATADKQPAGEKKGDQQQPSGTQNGEKKQNGEKSAAQQPAGEKGGNQKSGMDSSGGQTSDNHKSEDLKSENSKSEKTGNQGQNGEKGQAENQTGEKSSGGQSAEKKPAGEKTGGQLDAAQQQPGQQSDAKTAAKEKPGADTTGGQKSGTAAGGKEQQQKQPGGDNAMTQKKSAEEHPGQQPPGAGKNVGNNAGSPAPQQQEGQSRQQRSSQEPDSPSDAKGDTAQSPSTSPKPSDSKGQTAGDRSGGGEQGGGQRANQRGVGSAGSHTSADEGGRSAPEQGQGEVGNRAGNQAASKKPVDSTSKQQAEEGTGTRQTPSGEKGGGEKAGGQETGDHQATAENKSSKTGAPGQAASSRPEPGGATGDLGGGQATGSSAAPPPPPAQTAADEANLEYARRQTTLALEHLRDQLAKEKAPLLDRLGWSKDDARRFLDRWEQMRQAAAEKGQTGQSARQRFDDALQSLGLRPRSSELRPGGITPDRPQNLHDAGRFAPPPDWAEQFRQYTRGVAGEERKSQGQ